MAKLSNIQESKEFLQANKQALAELGFSAKEVDAIFGKMNKNLETQTRLTQKQLDLYKDSIAQISAQAVELRKLEQEKAKAAKKQKDTLHQSVQDHTKSVNKMATNLSGLAKRIPIIGDSFSDFIDDTSKDYNKFLEESVKSKTGKDGELASKSLSDSLGAVGKIAGGGILAGLTLFTKKAFDTMTELGLGASQTVGLGFQVFFGDQLKAITDEFGSINDSSTELVARMKIFSVLTGTSAEDLAKTVGLMAATSDLTNEALMSQIEITRNMAQQAGIPIKNIMGDVAQNTEFFAKFAKDGGQNILSAATQARQLGISLSEVSKISESLLDFETSIEKQLEAQVLLGKNINTDRARQLAFTGDTEGLMKEVTRLAGSEAEFNNMNYLQREALAAAIGLSVDEMSKLIRAENQAAAASGGFFKSTAGIATALGGALGLLLGALTGGVGLAKMAAGGAKGVAIGAGVGALAGTAASALPGLQFGGVVQDRGLVNVGEAGPELISPITGEGVNVDMSETNSLLRQLLTSSDKQVNRLSDIGTS